MYCVYKASFRTKAGTAREYIGFSGSLEERKRWMARKPNDWVKPAVGGVVFVPLEEEIASKGAARALEAIHAARAIIARPLTCRGGPWSSPLPLSASALREIETVARCRGLMAVYDIAKEHKAGPLWKHLRDLAFTKSSDAPSSAAVVRGAWVRRIKRGGKSGKSGTSGKSGRSGKSGKSGRGPPGNTCRQRIVQQGRLTRADFKFQQLHRGRDPRKRRRLETLNRRS